MEENSKDNNFSEFDIHMYQDEFLDAMEILADNTIKFIEKGAE